LTVSLSIIAIHSGALREEGIHLIVAVEHEQHALFECSMYAVLREKFIDLFRDDCRTLVQLLSFDQDYSRLSVFLTLCRKRRAQMSVRIA
jgi:hypothetical protein